MTASAGELLGSYRLLRPLGHGGMGEVWHAEHTTLGRRAAVKLVRADLLGQGEARARLLERFRREARATGLLTSAHAVTVHDMGVHTDGSLWYAMELLDGLDLDTLVQQHGPLPAARVVHLLAQACDALAEAHVGGLVHRDIKPANLFSCRQGMDVDFVKVLDFGLALPLLEAGDGRLTGDGAITGSPTWIAPEAALGAADLDHRADIYGLGGVAYWLLTGQPVFEADHPLKLVMHHVGSQPVPPSQRLGQPVPADLEALVLACLAKSPADRPASAAVLKARLRGCEVAAWTAEDAAQWWQAHGPQAKQQDQKPDSAGPTSDWGVTVEASASPAPTPVVAARAPDVPPVTSQPVQSTSASPPLAGPAVLAPARHQPPAALSAERAEVVGQLRDAFSRSLLDMREFEHRVVLAEAARDAAELKPLVADLPKSSAAAPAVLSASSALAAPAEQLMAVFSGIQRGGSWAPPARSRMVCVFGGAELDFRDADLQPGCTELRLVCVMGGAELTVPPDVPVVMHGTGFFGAFHKKGGSDVRPADPSKPWLLVTGVAVFGGVEVRVRPRRADGVLAQRRRGE